MDARSTGESRVSSPSLATSRIDIQRRTAGTTRTLDDWIAVEEPLEIRVRHPGQPGSTVSLTMRTPGRDCDLAVGFLFGEGLITRRGDVIAVETCDNAANVVNVTLAPELDPGRFVGARGFYMSSSCGLCGKRSLDAVVAGLRGRRVGGQATVSGELLTSLPARVRDAQQGFDQTGGLHGAALVAITGELLDVAEDVGRHNAVDKVLGRAWLRQALPATDHVLLLSGRAGFELLQKAAFAGVSIVAAVGAPSSLAVDLARESGITLVGFLGSARFNIYAGAARIDG